MLGPETDASAALVPEVSHVTKWVGAGAIAQRGDRLRGVSGWASLQSPSGALNTLRQGSNLPQMGMLL